MAFHLSSRDQASTCQRDMKERYRAPAGVFSHMAVVAIETPNYINHLVELGVIELPWALTASFIVLQLMSRDNLEDVCDA